MSARSPPPSGRFPPSTAITPTSALISDLVCFEGFLKTAITFFARRQPFPQSFEFQQLAVFRNLPAHRKQGALKRLDLLRWKMGMRVKHAMIKTWGRPQDLNSPGINM